MSHPELPLLENSKFQIRKGPHPLTPLLLRQVSPWLCPSTHQGMHLAAALENSTLRRMSSFTVAMSIAGPLDAIKLFADEELVGT